MGIVILINATFCVLNLLCYAWIGGPVSLIMAGMNGTLAVVLWMTKD